MDSLKVPNLYLSKTLSFSKLVPGHELFLVAAQEGSGQHEHCNSLSAKLQPPRLPTLAQGMCVGSDPSIPAGGTLAPTRSP